MVNGISGSATIALMLFSLGSIVQDLTDYLADSETKHPVRRLISKFVDFGEDDLRVNTLFKSTEQTDGIRHLNGLGKELFASKGIRYTLRNKSLLLEKFDEIAAYSAWNGSHQEEDLRHLVAKIYYSAKNWCYAQSNYYDELNLIEERIDLSRSVSITSMFFVLLFSAFAFLTLILQLFLPIRQSAISKRLCISCGYGIIGFFTVALMAIIGYGKAEGVYNERVFGYYTSYLGNYRINNPNANLLGKIAMSIQRATSNLEKCGKGGFLRLTS